MNKNLEKNNPSSNFFSRFKTGEGKMSLYILIMFYIVGMLSYFGMTAIVSVMFNLTPETLMYHSTWLLFYSIILVPYLITSTLIFTSNKFILFIKSLKNNFSNLCESKDAEKCIICKTYLKIKKFFK